jgi:uncharacterized protein
MMTESATIIASEIRMMESKRTGREYRISISLPYAYSKSSDVGWPFDDTPERWPIVYLLNANWYFGLVTDIVRITAWCGSTTDAIVVGIGYPEDDDPIESFNVAYSRRGIDLTPVRSVAWEQTLSERSHRPSPTGDASNFFQFIKHELIPTIDQEFRTDASRRVLVGQSNGGLFVAMAMFEQPNLFDTYIVGAPTLAYGERFAFKREEEFSKAHTQLSANVYIYVGELEESADNTTLTDALRFAAILQSRKYEGLTLIKQVFVDHNHCEVVAPGIQAGLKFALKKQGQKI